MLFYAENSLNSLSAAGHLYSVQNDSSASIATSGLRLGWGMSLEVARAFSRACNDKHPEKKKKRGSSASLDLGVPLNGWFFIWGLDVSGTIILILTI